MEQELFCFMPFFMEGVTNMNDFTNDNMSAWLEGDGNPFAAETDKETAPFRFTDEIPVIKDSILLGFPEQDQAEEGISEEAENDLLDEPEDETEEATSKESDKNDGSPDDEKKRKEHEAAEAKRKAVWEAKQQVKKAAEQEQMNRLLAMSNEEVMAASMQRISSDTERLTRRNMKEFVSEYIQTKCLDDPAFARLTLHPKKTMVHCFWYINRKAREFIEHEVKDNDNRPENGVYGGDVPDELCYQWAEEYFRDPDAEEDKEKEEKFVAKPYSGKSSAGKSSSRKKQNKTADKKTTTEKQADKSEPEGQMSFIGQMSLPGFEEEVNAG